MGGDTLRSTFTSFHSTDFESVDSHWKQLDPPNCHDPVAQGLRPSRDNNTQLNKYNNT